MSLNIRLFAWLLFEQSAVHRRVSVSLCDPSLLLDGIEQPSHFCMESGKWGVGCGLMTPCLIRMVIANSSRTGQRMWVAALTTPKLHKQMHQVH